MKYNFGAGPCILPQEVFEQAAQAVLNFNNSGLSILEISHRSKDFEAVMDEALQLTRELLRVPANYSIAFIQGGASAQFAMVPMNLLKDSSKAAYLDTGVWASKAYKEAARIGNAQVIASSSDKNYNYIPKDFEIDSDYAYLHITTNNTIYGTEIFELPKTELPIVADMSSDIFSRDIQVSDYGLIYAGAQKNLGPAGFAVVIVKDELLNQTGKVIPNIFNYSQHIQSGSMYNTPPVYSIYVSLLNLRWLKNKGGIQVMEEENKVKARKLYEEIERNSLFKATAEKEDRSRMNVTFVMENQELEEKFLNFTKERGIIGIKGHRSVGGFRASIYNAMGITGIHVLVDAMQEFEDLQLQNKI